MTERNNLTEMLRAIDLKQRDYWDKLSPEQKKKHSSYLALRYASSVSPVGSKAKIIEKYYINSTNEYANENYFDLSKHPKLQWLLITCISPGAGTHRHEFISFKSRKSSNKRFKIFQELYPDLKDKDLEMLESMTSDEELKDMFRSQGLDEKTIKEKLNTKEDK